MKLFVKSLCDTHIKDRHTAYLKCFVVLLLLHSCLGSDGEPKRVRQNRNGETSQLTVKKTCTTIEIKDSIPVLEGLETLPLGTGSNSNSTASQDGGERG